jgi:hypothetical protein
MKLRATPPHHGHTRGSPALIDPRVPDTMRWAGQTAHAGSGIPETQGGGAGLRLPGRPEKYHFARTTPS